MVKRLSLYFDDADLDAASQEAVVGGFVNAGQDCTAAPRFYVHERIYDKFANAVVAKAKRIRVGDPLKESTDMGPLISGGHRTKVEKYVEAGKKEGAKLLLGGHPPKGHLYDKDSILNPQYFQTQNRTWPLFKRRFSDQCLRSCPSKTLMTPYNEPTI